MKKKLLNMKRKISLLSTSIFIAGAINAQTVSGKVTDNKNGEPIFGSTVLFCIRSIEPSLFCTSLG